MRWKCEATFPAQPLEFVPSLPPSIRGKNVTGKGKGHCDEDRPNQRQSTNWQKKLYSAIFSMMYPKLTTTACVWFCQLVTAYVGQRTSNIIMLIFMLYNNIKVKVYLL